MGHGPSCFLGWAELGWHLVSPSMLLALAASHLWALGA